jgi:hypothetical protein
VSAGAPALLIAAGGVGFGHAILPDHWMPLAVVGRTRRYPLGRVCGTRGAVVGSVIAFAAVTIGTIGSLTVAAARGGHQIRGVWLERWGNAFTALVLLVIGTLVLPHVI